MAHAAKHTAAAAGHLGKHYERAKDGNGEYIKFGNQNIDTSRSHLNYNLAPEREGGQVEFIRQRTSEVRCLKREDVKVMCSWVVTLPKYRWHDERMHVHFDQERVERTFFERVYNFMAKRYGEENVISAYVHKDEVTPHIHFAFVPVVEDKKRGGKKVSAKDVLTRKELQNFHVELEQHLDSFKDWHFEVINDATRDGNKTVAELKVETAHQKVVEAENKLAEVQGRVNTLEKQKKALEGEIKALTTEKEVLTTAEVEKLKGTKTITGALKGVTYKEYEALVKTAAKVDRMTEAVERADARASAADRRADAADERANEAVQKYARAEQQRQSVFDDEVAKARKEARSEVSEEVEGLERANLTLTRTVIRQKKAIEFLTNFVKTRLPEFFKTVEAKVQALLEGRQGRDRSD